MCNQNCDNKLNRNYFETIKEWDQKEIAGSEYNKLIEEHNAHYQDKKIFLCIIPVDIIFRILGKVLKIFHVLK